MTTTIQLRRTTRGASRAASRAILGPACLGLVLALAWSIPGHAAEGRIPIFQPIELIAAPDNPISGKYILTNDIEADDGKPVISIKGSGFEQVEIDLNGFTVTANGTALEAIAVDDVQSFVLRNGTLVSTVPEFAEVLRVGKTPVATILFPVRRLLVENVTTIGGPDIAIAIYGVENFTLLDNSVLEPAAQGIQVKGSPLQSNTQGRVERNLVRGAGGHGIEAEGDISSVIVRDNQIEGVGGNGIHAAPGSGVAIISGNAIEKTGRRGIFVNHTGSCRVEGNAVRGAGQRAGAAGPGNGIFLASDTKGCLVLSNSSNDNAMHGMLIEGQGNHVDRNILTGNGGYGLLFATTASKNTFGRNTAQSNGGSGCSNPSPCPGLAVPEFCDNTGSVNNVSFGDNLAPGGAGGPC